jgi:hypothetical protein
MLGYIGENLSSITVSEKSKYIPPQLIYTHNFFDTVTSIRYPRGEGIKENQKRNDFYQTVSAVWFFVPAKAPRGAQHFANDSLH